MFRPFFLLLLVSVAAAQKCRCNAPIEGLPTPSSLSNRVQQVTSILLDLIVGTPPPIHPLAVVTGSMYEALLFSINGKQMTSATVNSTLSGDDLVGYAGYAALNIIFTASNEPDKIVALDKSMRAIGLKSKKARDSFGAPFAKAIIKKFPVTDPPKPYKPPNKASTIPGDAQCRTIKDADGWQPLCVGGNGKCMPQKIPFSALVDAGLISSDGKREVGKLISIIPSAPRYDGKLKDLPLKGGSKFVRQFRKVLTATTKLDDYAKTVAEVFAPDFPEQVLHIAFGETVARKLDLKASATVLFAAAAASRDALCGSSTVKVRESTTRPISVLQCGLRMKKIKAWKGPYQGVGTFKNTRSSPWRPYLQTPPFPSYISGHTTLASATAATLKSFFKEDTPKGPNCFVRAPGDSMREPKRIIGEDGYIRGVTDVPNTGPGTVGFAPAKKTTVCWRTWTEYTRLVAKSRLVGGVHTPIENTLGIRLGKRAAKQTENYLKGRTV